MSESRKLKRLKQKRDKQTIAAHVQFEEYKQYITNRLVENFEKLGGAYQTAEMVKKTWRDSFAFQPECEKFLISKTKFFLFFFLEDKQTCRSPYFLRTLVGLMSEYLSKYICRKGISRDDCTQQLIKMLFTDNAVIKNKIEQYQNDLAVSQNRSVKTKKNTSSNSNKAKTIKNVYKANQDQTKLIMNLKNNVSKLVK